MKIGVVSLGCSKNLIDSQTAMKFLTRNGHVFTDNPANADAIIVLEHGQIIERGNHDDLIAQKGRYYQLYTGKAELD